MYKFENDFKVRPAKIKGTQIIVSDESVNFISTFVELMNNGYIPVILNQNFTQEEKEKIKNILSKKDPRFNYGNYFILCTSGTTGYTKLVVHSYDNILTTGEQFSKILNATKDDVFFSAAKMFHAYGLGNSFSIPQSCGASVVYSNHLITPQRACNLIEENNVTIFCGVPRHYASFVKSKIYPQNKSLRICLSAGEKLPLNIKKEFERNTGVEILDAIGSTETLGFMLCDGRPIKGVDLRLDSEELLIKSNSMFLGYYNETTHNINDPWIRTGDLYEIQNGLYIHKGRRNELVKVNGNKIYTNVVEQELLDLAGVSECSITTFKSSTGLEKLKLDLVCDNYRNIKQEILTIAKKYQVTFLTELKNELPRTSTGKIKKYILQQQ